MPVETCPLFNDLHWITHRFFGREMAVTNDMVGLQKFGKFSGLVFFMPQTHSDVIITPDDPLPAGGADAVISDKPLMGLAVKTADCIPLLIVCPHTRLIAAVHAGWPGALNDIIPKTIARMEAMGAYPFMLRVAMGPSLQRETFHVRQDLFDKFTHAKPETEKFFTPVADYYLFDPHAMVTEQLQDCGVKDIWQSRINTFGSAAHHSYRRRHQDDTNEHMRNVSVITRTT